MDLKIGCFHLLYRALVGQKHNLLQQKLVCQESARISNLKDGGVFVKNLE